MTEKRYATAEDFKRRDIDLTIKMIDDNGEEYDLLLPIRTLSFFQAQKIRASVTDPTPPANGITKDAGGSVRPTLDYNDPGYRMALELANTERMYRIFLAALRQDLFPVPGNTDEAKLEYIKENFDNAVIQAVMAQLNVLAGEARAVIQSRVDTFQ